MPLTQPVFRSQAEAVNGSANFRQSLRLYIHPNSQNEHRPLNKVIRSLHRKIYSYKTDPLLAHSLRSHIDTFRAIITNRTVCLR